jgi:hypothetical protein
MKQLLHLLFFGLTRAKLNSPGLHSSHDASSKGARKNTFDVARRVPFLVSRDGCDEQIDSWFLFEELTGRLLQIPDLRQGNYLPLLDPAVHVTGPTSSNDFSTAACV